MLEAFKDVFAGILYGVNDGGAVKLGRQVLRYR